MVIWPWVLVLSFTNLGGYTLLFTHWFCSHRFRVNHSWEDKFMRGRYLYPNISSCPTVGSVTNEFKWIEYSLLSRKVTTPDYELTLKAMGIFQCLPYNWCHSAAKLANWNEGRRCHLRKTLKSEGARHVNRIGDRVLSEALSIHIPTYTHTHTNVRNCANSKNASLKIDIACFFSEPLCVCAGVRPWEWVIERAGKQAIEPASQLVST